MTGEEEEASLFRSVIEAQSDLSVRLDDRGRIRYANPSFCHAIGVPATLVIGNRIGLVAPSLAWLAPQGRGRFDERFEERFEERVDAIMTTAHGSRTQRFDWVLSPVRQADGRTDELQAVGRPAATRTPRAHLVGEGYPTMSSRTKNTVTPLRMCSKVASDAETSTRDPAP